MAGEGFLRIAKMKGANIITAAARHNRREIQAEHGASLSIHPERSAQNQTIAGPATADAVGQMARDLMAQAGVDSKRLRKDAVRCVEFVFSLPPGHPVDAGAYFSDCLEWTQRTYGGHVLSADVHHDEAAPHCHVLVLPLLQGRMVGSGLVGDRRKLAAAQNSFHAEVASTYGLRKAPARLAGASKERAAALVLEKLKALSDPILRSAAWPVARDAIVTDPRPWLEALGLDCAPTKKKPLKTMAQIFTGTGKGPRKEPNPIGFAAARETDGGPNHIGFAGQEKHRNLCSVGFAPKAAPKTAPLPPAPATPAAPAPAATATTTATPAAPAAIVVPATPAPAAPATPAPAAPATPAPAAIVVASTSSTAITTRHRDTDQQPGHWCERLGDFIPAAPARQRARTQTDAWVRAALARPGAQARAP